MPSLKDFIAALQAGWFPALAALVGCSIMLAGDYFEVPYLDASPDVLLTVAVVVAVFAFSVLVANVARLPFAIWKALNRRQLRREFLERLVREIETAPDTEKIILAYLATSGRRAFAAEFNDRRLAPLVSKGLIIRQGGTNSVLEWPYIVRQEVWDYLMDNRESYRIELPDPTHDPFHWRGSGW